MKKFYITFGQLHPLRDCYIVVMAETKEAARRYAFEVLGNKWAGLYTRENFNPSYCPGAQAGKVIHSD